MLVVADPTIILVHGAFADASSWSRLYAGLPGDGLRIKALPNPLRGVTVEDAGYTRCVIEQVEGPVLLVGHSYGGAVIASGWRTTWPGWCTSREWRPMRARSSSRSSRGFPRPSSDRISSPPRCLMAAGVALRMWPFSWAPASWQLCGSGWIL
jgi:hypothetical protein